jgi:hypothetical protein
MQCSDQLGDDLRGDARRGARSSLTSAIMSRHGRRPGGVRSIASIQAGTGVYLSQALARR